VRSFAGNRMISFNISLSGTLSGGDVIAFNAGGSQFEDNQWHNFLQQVQALCNQ